MTGDEDEESFGEEEFDTESEGSNSDFDEDIVKKKKRKTAKVNKQCRAASGGTSVKAKSSAPSSIQTSRNITLLKCMIFEGLSEFMFFVGLN